MITRYVVADALQTLLDEVATFHREHALTLRPISDGEIDGLGRMNETRVPLCLRRTLRTVGVMTNPFRMFGRLRDWRTAKTWLDQLGLEMSLFAFEDDGAQNYWCLEHDDDDGDAVYFVDHDDDCTAEPSGQSFVEHVRERWDDVQGLLARNDYRREWMVQFSWSGEPDDLLATVAAALGAQILVPFGPDRRPLQQLALGTLPIGEEREGVANDHAVLLAAGRRIELERRPYGLRSGIHATVSDPEDRIDDGIVTTIRAACRRSHLAPTEVDYGLLSVGRTDRRRSSGR